MLCLLYVIVVVVDLLPFGLLAQVSVLVKEPKFKMQHEKETTLMYHRQIHYQYERICSIVP